MTSPRKSKHKISLKVWDWILPLKPLLDASYAYTKLTKKWIGVEPPWFWTMYKRKTLFGWLLFMRLEAEFKKSNFVIMKIYPISSPAQEPTINILLACTRAKTL